MKSYKLLVSEMTSVYRATQYTLVVPCKARLHL